ncbi:hypothetical protein CEXT_764641 [Caerostris extrusa]|uniref:Uncharacterized protein n=1 Tax=Caerostris extrusa TaxID=172846 RepID=A0AAV4N2K9_CAEEX|nr:hypothetical protein CEXT_764641 [Caerostris extrusa]
MYKRKRKNLKRITFPLMKRGKIAHSLNKVADGHNGLYPLPLFFLTLIESLGKIACVFHGHTILLPSSPSHNRQLGPEVPIDGVQSVGGQRRSTTTKRRLT